MAYINNIILKGMQTPITTGGNYIFLTQKKSPLIYITVYSDDGVTVEERHSVETIAVLNLTANKMVEVSADAYMVSLAGGSAAPSLDPTKLDTSVYNIDKPTFVSKTDLNGDQAALLTKLNAAISAISGATDFKSAKAALGALLPITRAEV